MIDAAGAIYVIGGTGGGTYYDDVWASADGGADLARAGVRGVRGAAGVQGTGDEQAVRRSVLGS